MGMIKEGRWVARCEPAYDKEYCLVSIEEC
jgi:hypothetical protein